MSNKDKFLAGLIAIRDGVNTTQKANVNGLEVTRRSGTVLDDAIGSRNTINNRLKIKDRNAVNYKTSRIQSISKQQPTNAKPKYVVLDSRAIKEIRAMNNIQRRNFLAHLSDSDRRRVLRAIRVKDDLEDGQLKRRDLNRELEPQDLYVINDLLTKFAYSRKDDELRMLESYKDLLDETDGQELAVLTLINKVIDGDLDMDADAEVINNVFNFFEDNGFETDSLDASLTAAFGGVNATDVVSEDEENADDLSLDGNDIDSDLDIEGEDDLGADLDMEGDEDLGLDNENNDLDEDTDNDVDLSLGDSAKTKALTKNKIADSKQAKKPTQKFNEDIETKIIDDSYDLAMGVLKGEITNIVDCSNDIVAKYSELTGDNVRVKDCFDRAFACSINKISNFLHKDINVQKVKDDIIEDIDNQLGEETTEAEGKTLLESLGSALEAFANGDNTELQALAELTVDDVQPEEDFDITNEDEDADNEEENNEDELDLEDEDDDLSINLGDSVVNLAKALLNNDKKANVYIDRLKDSVDILRKYNFKISDSELMEEEEYVEQPDVDVVEPLLTREEFQSTYEYPVYVGEMAKEANPVACINPTSVNYGDINPIIQVECNGAIQNWMPITGSNEKVVEQLNQEGVDVAKTISDNCVPIEDYYAAAAKTNNLGLIDDKFYKRKLSDSGWVCEGIADCIANCEGVEEGATFMQSGLTTMPKMVPSGSVLIYGTKYDY